MPLRAQIFYFPEQNDEDFAEVKDASHLRTLLQRDSASAKNHNLGEGPGKLFIVRQQAPYLSLIHI